MPIMTDKRDGAKGPAPLDSDAAQAEPAGAQSVPSGSAREQDGPTQEEVNFFLDDLRESGKTNMFGAAPYIRRAYGVSFDAARDFLTVWMRTFRERHPPEAK